MYSNITRLTRNGYTAGSFAQIDDLECLYEGNRLKTVNDLSRMREGFTDNAFVYGTDDYTYDANGNLKSDLNKSISDIEYNFVNLPEKISMQNGNRIEYSYTTTGAKLAKQVYEQDRLQSSTQYSGAFVYEDDAVSYLLFSEGRLLYEGNKTWKFEYHIEDHLGNVRVAFEPENNNKITQKNDYYPFGMQIQYNQFELPGTNKYLYNSLSRTCFGSKEMQDDFGLDWLDYGARFYDSEIGRWHVADALSEFYSSTSPYGYVENNPISFIDPNGMFRTRFGAWWYKLWNGGDAIGQHKGGEYFVTTTTTSEDEEGGVTVTASRVFDRKGRNFGRNLALQRAAEDYVSQMRFEENLQQMGAEIRYTDSRIEAFSSWVSLGALPNIIGGGTSVVNSAKSTRQWAKAAMRDANVNPLSGTENCTAVGYSADLYLRTGTKSSALSIGLSSPSKLASQVGKGFSKTSLNALKRTLLANGEGSTAIIHGVRFGKPGHVFNAVVKNNQVIFMDFQTGKTISSGKIVNTFRRIEAIITTGL